MPTETLILPAHIEDTVQAIAKLHADHYEQNTSLQLQGALGLLALYVTVLILTTQRREDQLAGYREQLTLELAILGEQKSAKIIALLEEMRRDSPHLQNRVDEEAEAMAVAADPQAVLDAIKETEAPPDIVDALDPDEELALTDKKDG